MRSDAQKRSAGIVLAVGVAAFAIACKSGGATTSESKSTLSNVSDTGCPDGFEAAPGGACFIVPDHAAKDTPVLVYLHGVYEGRGSAQEWQAVKVASQRGFAVVIPRGKRGLCGWRAELKDHFCWPQDLEDTPTVKGVIAEWDRVLWQVDALLEPGTHKRYVLGYAEGGAFASFIATHALFPGQAYAVVNAAPLPPSGKSKAVPIMLVSAQDDAEHGPKMRELHDTLSKVGWTHAFCPRPGPRAITTDDVEGAIKFFKHEADGSLKAPGGGYACEPPPRR